MKNFLKKVSPASHIMIKIWLATASIALSVLLLISLASQLLFGRYFMEHSLSRARTNTNNTADALGDSLENILDRFVDICGTSDFQKEFMRIRRTGKSDYAELNNTLQDTLRDLRTANPLISSVVITSRTGLTYRLSSEAIHDIPDYTLGYPEEIFHGITMLPSRSSPINGQKDVIPIAFPLTRMSQNNYTIIASDISESEAIVFLLLDADQISNYVHIYSDNDVSGTLSLYSGERLILNTENGGIDDIAASLCASLGADCRDLTVPDGRDYLLLRQIGKSGLFLVNRIKKHVLLASLYNIQHYLLLAAAAGILTITISTLITARTITKPLSRLMNAVHSIEDQTYQSSQVLSQSDEIGRLSRALDSMYQTIQKQIEEIRQERNAKYNAEIRLFSEQINPHFLYNTLEYINMEVYNQHTENASLMIQNLGDFMRIGLNFGGERIPLIREAAHVQAYVNIMNCRFSHKIRFVCDIPEQLQSYEILKIILQPLAENSIRHGFGLDSQSFYLDTPTIRISAHAEEERLILRVTDNGSGIDVEKAERILHAGTEGQKHVGLNNVYQRLLICYGPSAEITFSSIPYYKNTVQISIPYRKPSEINEEEAFEEKELENRI